MPPDTYQRIKVPNVTDSFYKFHTEKKTWEEAKAICDEEGSYLAIINSKGEAKLFSNMFMAYTSENYAHIGFSTPNYRTIGKIVSTTKYENIFNKLKFLFYYSCPHTHNCKFLLYIARQ